MIIKVSKMNKESFSSPSHEPTVKENVNFNRTTQNVAISGKPLFQSHNATTSFKTLLAFNKSQQNINSSLFHCHIVDLKKELTPKIWTFCIVLLKLATSLIIILCSLVLSTHTMLISGRRNFYSVSMQVMFVDNQLQHVQITRRHSFDCHVPTAPKICSDRKGSV